MTDTSIATTTPTAVMAPEEPLTRKLRPLQPTAVAINRGISLKYAFGYLEEPPVIRGTLEFIQHPVSGKICVLNGGLTRNAVRQLLHQLADFVADNGEFEE